MRVICLLVIAAVPSVALGDFTGRVIKVSDGDTLTVLVHETQFRVRLDAIDAPESRQAFGERSRQSLAELCAGRIAHVLEQGKDRYGRTVGRVRCASVDANSEQVRRGMAWVADRYASAASPLYKLQWEARSMKRGLWADPQPMAPWEWRAAMKRERQPQDEVRTAGRQVARLRMENEGEPTSRSAVARSYIVAPSIQGANSSSP